MKDTTTERVGRYQLLEPIGMGPCGAVSRAKVFGVAGFERQFAVKRFYPELTITSALAQGLSAAARAYGSLEHPRIARMSEFGVAQGQTFTAVEFIPGLDALRLVAEARLGGTSLAAGGALALVSQAARAVGYAHGRGLVHLGLSPTNVIVTGDGDLKITDFALLAASLPQRPVDVARLAQRIQYLAPEQLANEATSAATDVFSLGVLAYELVTGQRTFRGDTPQQVAQAIMGGPPPEPSLPRPIVRVLQRCVARSPFERFPDARALADALDAALRVAPVPGTRKDVGALVKHTMDRIAALREGELSGMLAVNVGTGPIRRDEPVHEIATLGRDSQPTVAIAGTSPLFGPSTTVPDMPRPILTMTGLPPPPIPVPQGLASPPSPPAAHHPGGASTLLGMPKVPMGIPQIKPRPSDHNPDVVHVPMFRPTGLSSTPKASASPQPAARAPARLDTEAPTGIHPPPMDLLFPRRETESEAGLEFEVERRGAEHEPDEPEPDEDDQSTILGSSTAQSHSSQQLGEHELLTEEPLLNGHPDEAPTQIIADTAPPVAEAWHGSGLPDDTHGSAPRSAPHGSSAPLPSTMPGAVPRTRPGASLVNDANHATMATRKSPGTTTNRTPLIIAAVLIAGGGIAIASLQLFKTKESPSGTRIVAPVAADPMVIATPRAGPADAGSITDTGASIATLHADAGAVSATVHADAGAVSATVHADAGAVSATVHADAATVIATAPADAGTAKAPVNGAQTSDTLTITSKPAGAHVFLDGSDSGVTPLNLPGSADRHTIALLLPGHDLYIAQVDGHGAFSIPLKEITPTAGPAGIKVLKCKDKDRYYVFVDGKPTGQMCPTERIETDVGTHTVEVYDAGTESRKKWDIVVKDTRLSYRVKIE